MKKKNHIAKGKFEVSVHGVRLKYAPDTIDHLIDVN